MRHSDLRRLLALALAGMLGACTYTEQLNTRYFPEPPSDMPRVSGGAAVAMPAADEARIRTQRPQSSFGAGADVAVPVDRIVKEAALAAFGPVLSGGVISTTDIEAPAGMDFVIEPTVQNYAFVYGAADVGVETTAIAVTPYVALSVRIVAKDASGQVRLDRVYETNFDSRPVDLLSFMPNRQMNQTLHVIAFDLMTAAARDFAAAVEAEPAP